MNFFVPQLRQKVGTTSSGSAAASAAAGDGEADIFASVTGTTISRPGGALIALGMGIGSAAGKAGASNSNSMTRVRTNIQAGKTHARGVFEPAVMPTADPVARPRGTRCAPPLAPFTHHREAFVECRARWLTSRNANYLFSPQNSGDGWNGSGIVQGRPHGRLPDASLRAGVLQHRAHHRYMQHDTTHTQHDTRSP